MMFPWVTLNGSSIESRTLPTAGPGFEKVHPAFIVEGRVAAAFFLLLRVPSADSDIVFFGVEQHVIMVAVTASCHSPEAFSFIEEFDGSILHLANSPAPRTPWIVVCEGAAVRADPGGAMGAPSQT